MNVAGALVYLGTHTDSGSRGIYALRFDAATGTLGEPVLAIETSSPFFLELDPTRRRLYSVDQAGEGVEAFAIEPATGRLTRLNRQAAGGSVPCHLAVAGGGRMLIVSCYGGGTVCSFPIEADGSLGPYASRLEPKGPPGPNPRRQKAPHPHSVTLSPDGRFALVADLGLDRVLVYRIDPATATLAPHDPPYAELPPGAGPRHAKFSADGRFFYVLNELAGSVSVFAYDPAAGALALRQTLASLPADFSGLNGSAEIRLHPNGRFLYVCNRDIPGTSRGSDSVAVFACDPSTGLIRLVEIRPSGGRIPQNIALSPDGRWLLVANDRSDRLALFQVDPGTGKLTATGREVAISRPVCILFYP